MFGVPNKAKVVRAFRDFEHRLAALRDEADQVPPPDSDTLILMGRRLDNLERLIQDLKDSF